MDKKEKRALNNRLLVIYVCYFVILGVGFFHSFMPLFSSAFRAGWREAEQQIALAERGIEQQTMTFTVQPKLFTGKSVAMSTKYDYIQVDAEASEVITDVKITIDENTDPTLIESLQNKLIASTYLGMASWISWIAILVIIAVIINSLRKSIREQRPLPTTNIGYTRIIGILVIADELFRAFEVYIGHRAMHQILDSEAIIQIGQNFPIEYGSIVLGLLIIFSAEVFAIGARLSEEQEFTI